jgi:hypothetical protein
MQAYLIDPKAKTVESCDYDGDWKSIYTLIECSTFDIAATEEFSVYIDDEGLFAPERCFFMIDGYPQPLCNKGLLLGPVEPETGETLESPLTLEEAQEKVKFLTFEDVMKIASDLAA